MVVDGSTAAVVADLAVLEKVTGRGEGGGRQGAGAGTDERGRPGLGERSSAVWLGLRGGGWCASEI